MTRNYANSAMKIKNIKPGFDMEVKIANLICIRFQYIIFYVVCRTFMFYVVCRTFMQVGS